MFSQLFKKTNQSKKKERKKNNAGKMNSIESLTIILFYPDRIGYISIFFEVVFATFDGELRKHSIIGARMGLFKAFMDFKDLSLVEHRLCGLIGSFPSRVTWKIQSIWSNSQYYVRSHAKTSRHLLCSGVCLGLVSIKKSSCTRTHPFHKNVPEWWNWGTEQPIH